MPAAIVADFLLGTYTDIVDATAKAFYERHRARERAACIESSPVGASDCGTVQNRIGEGKAELERVNTRRGRCKQQPQRLLGAGITGGEVSKQRRPVLCARAFEECRETLHPPMIGTTTTAYDGSRRASCMPADSA